MGVSLPSWPTSAVLIWHSVKSSSVTGGQLVGNSWAVLLLLATASLAVLILVPLLLGIGYVMKSKVCDVHGSNSRGLA